MSPAPIKMQACSSSMLSHHGYNAATKTMAVTFRDGKTYRYQGVSPAQYAAFTKAKSLGRHFAKHIRGKFEHNA